MTHGGVPDHRRGQMDGNATHYQALTPNRGRFTFKMNYQTVFEIGFRSFPWSALMHPVPFILIGVLLFRFRKGKQIYQAAGIIGAAMATLFFLLLAASLVPNFVELRHTLQAATVRSWRASSRISSQRVFRHLEEVSR
jgi:cytochrome bd-type quinol oxidase subunit 2